MILSAAIQKGGCGKSTLIINFAAWLANHGYRVLAIDFDPQANTTLVLLGEEPEFSLTDVIVGNKDIREVIAKTPRENLSVIPSNITMARLENYLIGDPDGSYKLNDIIERSKVRGDYDFILVDSPPSLGILTRNVFTASEFVLIPTTCAKFSVKGLEDLNESILKVKERGNDSLNVLGAFINMYEGNKNIVRKIESDIEEYFGPVLFSTRVRRTIKVEEAMHEKKTIFEYSPDSTASLDFDNLCGEIMDRIKKHALIPEPAR